ncbi:MAG: SDR family oxidoreductase [Bacillus sp. (in: Bacteria)]|nr:SDR family oxidoreductase [Bacillus sp. (in: firmicutes)]
MDLGLKGKNVLVLASSKGLGRAVAEAYAKAGANVMLSARTEQALIQTAEEIASLGNGNVYWKTCDVSKKGELRELVDFAVSKLGGIDVLITNAGGPPPGKFEQLMDDQWQSAFELNVMSVVRAIRFCLPYLKKSKGKVVNITSMSMKEPVSGLLLSNVFRTGIMGLAKTLSDELAEYGILINTVGPGRIYTDRIKQLNKATASAANISETEVREKSEASIPLGRYGKPEEFANAILFLASDMNSYITGQAFVVDGGLTKAY